MATIKQKLVAERIIQNKGNVSKTMLEVGYSPNTAKNPSHITRAKGWIKLMAEHISEERLAQLHGEQLFAEKLQAVNGKPIMFPDNDARLKALDLGYKLRGKYAPDQFEITKRKYQDLSNKELADLIERGKNFLLKK